MRRIEAPETGTILGRRMQADGELVVAVAITLPESLWERLTGWVGELYADDRDGSPLSLGLRIGLFLDLQTQIWASEACGGEPRSSSFPDDLDDDVPF